MALNWTLMNKNLEGFYNDIPRKKVMILAR